MVGSPFHVAAGVPFFSCHFQLPSSPKTTGCQETPIRVTDRTDQSWTTTLTEVVDRTDTTIVVKNSARPRS